MQKKTKATKIGERGPSTASKRKLKEEEGEREKPFAKEIQELREMIEYVKREFRKEPVHIELSDW